MAQKLGYSRDRRGGFVRPSGGAGPPRQGARPQQTQGSSESRCVNCGQKGHRGADCPQPRVPPEKRPCFKCGKVGHTSSQCRSGGDTRSPPKTPGKINLVDFFGCLEYAPVKGKSFPQPRGTTIAEVVQQAYDRKNRFKARPWQATIVRRMRRITRSKWRV